jgi:transposase
MKKDGRKLSHENSEFIRMNAIERINNGESVREVMRSFGLSRTTAYPWLRKLKKFGMKSLQSSKSTGPKNRLSPMQMTTARTWICGKDPRQYGIDFGLWTRKIVQTLIKERFGIELSISSVGVLLSKLNITPQKPLQRAYQRDPVAISKWKTETYPKIKKMCKKANGIIFFMDEAGFNSDDTRGRTWGIRGETPVVKVDGRRQRVNAISAVSPNGAFWHQVYDGKLNSEMFINFIYDLIKRQSGHVFLIVDSLPAHKSKEVQEFLRLNKSSITLFFLPTYAPELNPDEFVWSYMKNNGTVKRPLRHAESLKSRVVSDLKCIKRKRSLVRSFFKASSVVYTAA